MSSLTNTQGVRSGIKQCNLRGAPAFCCRLIVSSRMPQGLWARSVDFDCRRACRGV